LNYNLHEFFGESAIREQLYELFVEFSLRSLPLPSKEITFSGRFIEMKKQFDILIEKTTILYVEVDKKIFCFGSFGSDFSDLNIPDSKQYLNDPQKSREFTFSASRANQLFLAQKSAHDMFKYMKEKYKYKIMGKFSSIPVYKAMIKQPQWKLLKIIRKMDKMKHGGTMARDSGFREYGNTSFSFEFIG